MIQKHCHECGAALIEKELEGEGIVPHAPWDGNILVAAPSTSTATEWKP